MKVCAHLNLSPYQHIHYRCDTVNDAINKFGKTVETHYGALDKSIHELTAPDHIPCVDIYPQCGDCNDRMNFHDYPMSRYQIGSRGGIRKVI